VYSTMQISSLAELVPFATFSEVEAIIVDAVKYDYLQVGGWGQGGRGAGGLSPWQPCCTRGKRMASGLDACLQGSGVACGRWRRVDCTARRSTARAALIACLATPSTRHPPPTHPGHLLQVRIDHRNGTLRFGSQQIESDRVRGHLATLARRLTKVASMVGAAEGTSPALTPAGRRLPSPPPLAAAPCAAAAQLWRAAGALERRAQSVESSAGLGTGRLPAHSCRAPGRERAGGRRR
jgi:hypothetical protein